MLEAATGHRQQGGRSREQCPGGIPRDGGGKRERRIPLADSVTKDLETDRLGIAPSNEGTSSGFQPQ